MIQYWCLISVKTWYWFWYDKVMSEKYSQLPSFFIDNTDEEYDDIDMTTMTKVMMVTLMIIKKRIFILVTLQFDRGQQCSHNSTQVFTNCDKWLWWYLWACNLTEGNSVCQRFSICSNASSALSWLWWSSLFWGGAGNSQIIIIQCFFSSVLPQPARHIALQ